MSLQCPHCQQPILIKEPKPGRFSPKCGKCGQKFLLEIPSDGQPPRAQKLPAAAAGRSAASASGGTPSSGTRPAPVDATLAAPSGTADATMAHAAPPPSPADATMAHDAPSPAHSSPAHSSPAARTAPGIEETIAPPAGPASGSSSAASAPVVRSNPAASRGASNAPSGAPSAGSGGFDATLPTGIGQGAPAPRASSSAATAAPGIEATMAQPSGGSRAVGSDGRALPESLGGYRIVRELGRGAMGAVYLAKQVSLDRDVALKVIQAQWSDNPAFVARFVREAYAAAQLTHHNVVQVYDLGADGDTQFFSMELVKGSSLADVVAQQQKLDVELAVGYVLQAARGLKFAHDQGMIHRDIKPANLLLSDQGVVKVADLGLVKTPGLLAEDDAPAGAASATAKSGGRESVSQIARADVTHLNVAMGTPAYMAPEQAENAARVDHRADIYSLGCTLYVLLTGRPPFEGATALEIISKHKSQPVVRPEALVQHIPRELSDICLKMVAKNPADRYADLAAVIRDLEGFLGVQTQGGFAPREEHLRTLEEGARAYQSASLARLRTPLALGFVLLSLVLLAAGLLFSLSLSAAALGALLAAPLAYFVAAGVGLRTYAFDKVREWLLGARLSDWGMAAAGALMALVVLLATGLLWGFLGGIAAGVLAGAALFAVDRQVRAQRRGALEQIDHLLKTLRLRGLDETALRQFVARYSGDHWEELYEELFGYEAKLAAREAWGKADGRRRPTFAAWRDPLIRAVESRLRERREARDRRLLQKVEEKQLQAQGMDLLQARKQAQKMAAAMVHQAGEVRAAAAEGGEMNDARRQKIKAMMDAAKRGEGLPEIDPLRDRPVGPIGFLLGPKPRFLAGAALLAAGLLWMNQNGYLSRERLETVAAEAQNLAAGAQDIVQSGSIERSPLAAGQQNDDELSPAGTAPDAASSENPAATDVPAANAASPASSPSPAASSTAGGRPLSLPAVPEFLTAWIDSFNPAVAGAMLVFAAMFFSGVRISFFVWPAALLMVLGHKFGLPSLGPLSAQWTALAGGAAFFAVGLVLGRSRH